MSSWARANTEAAWYQDDYPGSEINPNCGVIHTTEGTSLPGYSGGATAPQYTMVPSFERKRLIPFAHFPDERSGRALRNEPGGVETNTANCVQVELVGTCAPGTRDAWKRMGYTFVFWPDPPEWALRDLARFLIDMNRRHGIPFDGPTDERWKPYPESYGAGGQRFSAAEWRSFKGWCGHQHVPENSHGDPGDFPFSQLVKFAKQMKAGSTDSRRKKDPVETPRWDDIARISAAIAKDAKGGRREDAVKIRDLARKHSDKF